MAELALLVGVVLGFRFRLGLVLLVTALTLAVGLADGLGNLGHDFRPEAAVLRALLMTALMQVTALAVALAVEAGCTRATA